MRILHLVSYPIFSGPLPPTLGLALAQRRAGHEVWLAYDRKRGAFNDFEEAAEPVLQGLGLDPDERLVLSTKSSPRELWRDLGTLRRLAARVDVMHAHLSHDHLLVSLALPGAAKVARLRTFHAARSLAPRLGQGWQNRRADACIVRSEEAALALRERLGVEPARIAVIPGGIDAGRFRPASQDERLAARQRLGLAADAFVVAHVALVAGRGQEELAQALASLPAPRPTLLFVGRGEGEPVLRARVAALGLEHDVVFAGYLQGEALHAAYASADAAFLAQPGNDASARAGLEAMASGVPLLAVRAGPLAELVAEERGFAAASRAPSEIAEALRRLLGDRSERRRRAGRARDYVVRERDFAREAERTLAVYEDAIARRRGRRA